MDMKSSTDEWKSGTEALGLCTICGGEYSPTTKACPDCNVSLSLVRRCPSCHRVVSAKHTKCVHCRTAFTEDIPKELFPAELPTSQAPQNLSDRMRKFRAVAVSLVTFVVVFCLGLVFLKQMNKPNPAAHVIAKSQALNATELRHSPSLGASIVEKIVPGTVIYITGFRNGDQGLWMMLDWNHTVAYAIASDLTPPLALDANEGANVLKNYLLALDVSEASDMAVKAVDYYAQAFPGNPHRDELRWILAERLRALSTQSGPKGLELRRKAKEQYERLAATNDGYGEKARVALAKAPTSQEWVASSSRSKPARKPDGLQIVDDSGTHTLNSASRPRQVMVLTQTEVTVRAGKLSQSSEGTVVAGRVAYNVQTNGMVAIPAGARCQLKVVSADPSQANVSLRLTSIEIDHRVYPVRSTTTEVFSGDGSRPGSALTFHLDAPLVLER